MHRAATNVLLYVLTALFVGGCYFEVSTDSNKTTGTRTAEELAGLIVVQFAQQVDGVTADVVCPTGLSGQAGRKLRCSGTTSDGYTLEIEVVEREKGAFGWLVVESVPVTTAKKEKAMRATPDSGTEITTDVTTYVDQKTGQRCVKYDSGYICIED